MSAAKNQGHEELEVDDVDTLDEGPKSIYELFETDQTMEQQGVVVDFGPYGRFKVARAAGSNIKYADAFRKYNKPYQKMLKRGTMPESLARQITAKIYAEAIVLDWEGVIGRDRKPIPFTKENVVKLMLDLPDLFTQIIAESLNAENFRREYVEEAAGN